MKVVLVPKNKKGPEKLLHAFLDKSKAATAAMEYNLKHKDYIAVTRPDSYVVNTEGLNK